MGKTNKRAAAQFPGLWPEIRKSIRIIRNAHRVNQETLASLIGVERTTITNIETGASGTTIETIYAIAQALGVDVFAILPPMEDASREYKTDAERLEDLAACVLGAAKGNQASMAQAELIAARVLDVPLKEFKPDSSQLSGVELPSLDNEM